MTDVGRRRVEHLAAKLSGDTECGLAVVGPIGVGKTTLVRAVPECLCAEPGSWIFLYISGGEKLFEGCVVKRGRSYTGWEAAQHAWRAAGFGGEAVADILANPFRWAEDLRHPLAECRVVLMVDDYEAWRTSMEPAGFAAVQDAVRGGVGLVICVKSTQLDSVSEQERSLLGLLEEWRIGVPEVREAVDMLSHVIDELSEGQRVEMSDDEKIFVVDECGSLPLLINFVGRAIGSNSGASPWRLPLFYKDEHAWRQRLGVIEARPELTSLLRELWERFSQEEKAALQLLAINEGAGRPRHAQRFVADAGAHVEGKGAKEVVNFDEGLEQLESAGVFITKERGPVSIRSAILRRFILSLGGTRRLARELGFSLESQVGGGGEQERFLRVILTSGFAFLLAGIIREGASGDSVARTIAGYLTVIAAAAPFVYLLWWLWKRK